MCINARTRGGLTSFQDSKHLNLEVFQPLNLEPLT